ncbi:CHAT domain-containing protein [Streptomyces sp. DSM 44915]|uniref:CHAT domain-containing protein n=1 Tax=Streptomyces chisholmiae TaxID=3075540 RepID=A0ABU2JX13_9ACTN|nr:CHAT domain-containing protein [Streptomyces sp. DSM 44915]MDT0268763.1 CHAT domain-containing protein [Streptomyces sp. DSM 44915]
MVEQGQVTQGPSGGRSDEAAVSARAATAVRRAEEVLRRAEYAPVPVPALGLVRGAELDEAVSELVAVEDLLPVDAAERRELVPALGVLRALRHAVTSGTGLRVREFRPNPAGPPTPPAVDREAALGHLRWADRRLPLTDPLATAARLALVRLLAPKWLARAERRDLLEIVGSAARQRAADPGVWEAVRVQDRLARTMFPPTVTWRLVDTAQVFNIAVALSCADGGVALMGLPPRQEAQARRLFAALAEAPDERRMVTAVHAWLDLLAALPDGPMRPHFVQHRADLLGVLEAANPNPSAEPRDGGVPRRGWQWPAARAAAADLAALLDGDVSYFGGVQPAAAVAALGWPAGAPSGVSWLVAELAGGGPAGQPAAPGAAGRAAPAGRYGLWPADPDRLARAARQLRDAVRDPAAAGGDPRLAGYRPMARAIRLLGRARVEDRGLLDQAVARVRRCLDRGPILGDPEFHRLLEGALRCDLALECLRGALREHNPELLATALVELEMLHDLAVWGWGSGVEYTALSRLAHAHVLRARLVPATAADHLDRAVEAGRWAMNELTAHVLHQHGAEAALAAARAGATLALRVAGWAGERGRAGDVVEALEFGRALVLRAAAVSATISDRLRQRGFPQLAARWDATSWDVKETTDEESAAAELRQQAFRALGVSDRFTSRGGRGTRFLFETPSPALLGTELAECGADALAYLVPGDGRSPGYAVLLTPGLTGFQLLTLPGLTTEAPPLRRYLTAAADRSRALNTDDEPAAEDVWRGALTELCDWAWPAAIGPLLDALARRGTAAPEPRVVLVPGGPLGLVPWHAARAPGAGPYACQRAVFSYAASGAQLLRAVARRRRRPAERPALLASFDLLWAPIETDLLHAAYYPNARRYGDCERGEPDAPGTRDEVLAVLPGGDRPASLVHLSCHGMAGPSPDRSSLSLEDGELTVARLLTHAAGARSGEDAGPLVVLSVCETDLSTRDHDEALTVATALVTAGAADVVGSRWAVRDGATAVLISVFHHFLNTEGLAPADALRAAQLWMLDPDRTPPATLTGPLASEATRSDLHHPPHWAAFTHQGNPRPNG